uniref:C2H2-type domain-containing protein n=1 Tax=Rhodnius prolixus TaxID=13249 RepID=T1IGB7_RHOPR
MAVLNCNYGMDYSLTVGSVLGIFMTLYNMSFMFTECNYSSEKCDYIEHFSEKYKCSVCDYICMRASRFKEHMRIHTCEEPFKCSDCDYSFKRAGDLKRHMRYIQAKNLMEVIIVFPLLFHQFNQLKLTVALLK